MKYRILALLFSCNLTLAQTPVGVDSLMKSERIKTKTQLRCDAEGANCTPHIVLHYDSAGCLLRKETYVADTLTEVNRFEYNEHLLAKAMYTTYANGKEFLNVRYLYDGKLNLISHQICYANGKCEPYEKYRYRPDGKLLSRTRYRYGQYFYEYQHKYDKKGNNTEILILSNDSDSGERELKQYDERNLHVYSKWIDYLGAEIDHAEYTYDDQGRLLTNQWIGGLSTKKSYEYDSLGNNTKYVSLDYNGQVDDYRTMTYEGRLIASRKHYEGDKVIQYWKFHYERW